MCLFFLIAILFVLSLSFNDEEIKSRRKKFLNLRQNLSPYFEHNHPKNIPTIVPTDGMKISESCIFKKGEYHLPNGVEIVSDGVFINLGGSTLFGTKFENVGITINGRQKVEIFNGKIKNFYYGIKASNSDSLIFFSLDVSFNYLDPHSSDPKPPWLDINVDPSRYGDRTNLGGGIWLNNVTNGAVENCRMSYQENGIDMFNVHNFGIEENDFSHNVGWGIHLYKSTQVLIYNNKADNCTRKGPYDEYTADTAGLLMNCESNANYVIKNSFQYGGDGIFVSGFPREGTNECCPSINNFFDQNNCASSPNNAIENTFSTGNLFSFNNVSFSNYGFWLGYSHGNSIIHNYANYNRIAGIAIEHGQRNVIKENMFLKNKNGIFLWTDFIDHFPMEKYSCLALPDPKHSSFYSISENSFISNEEYGLKMLNTTESLIYNNIFEGFLGHLSSDGENGKNNKFFIEKSKEINIVKGEYKGGNYWSQYKGKDMSGDDIGDTDIPYLDNGGLKESNGDVYPLIDKRKRR